MSARQKTNPRSLNPESSRPICEQEPIHIPGAVQPHGAVLAARFDDWIVTHASANLLSILGLPAELALGRHLRETIGDAHRDLQTVQSFPEKTVDQLSSLLAPDGRTLSLHAHRAGRHICIDIEPNRRDSVDAQSINSLQAFLRTLDRATSRIELCEVAVRGLRQISGYDRVMAYRFAEDGHGEVIAEARASSVESYLGLHYPAADIPAQARRQYFQQRVGAIADSSYHPVPLLSDPALDDCLPLDLTHSALRSVSPVHREYMRNMNTGASLTIGLAPGQDLWGMLVCHHATPRIAGPGLRTAADIIGRVVSLLLGSTGELEVYSERQKRGGVLRKLSKQLAVPAPLPEALVAAETELLNVMNAAGVAMRFSGILRCLGRTPPPLAVEHALGFLLAEARGEVLAFDDLALRGPKLAACKRDGSGALLMPLASATDDAIVWFRPELPRTVSWAGNPTSHALVQPTTGQILPRASFAEWKESVSGQSAPWTDIDRTTARELRHLVETEVVQRAKAELAELHQQREEERRLQASRLEAAIENIGVGVVMFDRDKRLVICNDQYGKMYGLPVDLRKVGTLFSDIFSYIKTWNTANETDVLAVNSELDALSEPTLDVVNNRVVELSDGRFISVTRRPFEGGWVGTHEDITARHCDEAKISFLANHDLLTGLPNRALFTNKLDEAAARLQRRGEVFSVLMLDLDRFKQVNDTLGHPAGDELLKQVATRLRSSLRETDIVARLGGDEFVILQSGEDSQRESAVALSLRIEKILSRPFDLEGTAVFIGTSIGIAMAPENATSSNDLLKMADLALYSAKSNGKNTFSLFSPDMKEEADARHAMEMEMREGIARHEFELRYQPIIDAKTREVCVVESLVRWRHPVKGLIPPSQFIPLAEQNGLIIPLGEWIVQKACADAADWPEHVKVAVNVSALQFRKGNLADVISGALANSRLSPERLELEITESVLLENDDQYLTTIRQLKELGISFALDDFGTGYSSLGYLTRFPFNKIKIDKSFTREFGRRPDCGAVVSSLITLAGGIGMMTTAEGIETEDQFRLLRDAGVDLLQGYLFGRPVVLAELKFSKWAPANQVTDQHADYDSLFNKSNREP